MKPLWFTCVMVALLAPRGRTSTLSSSVVLVVDAFFVPTEPQTASTRRPLLLYNKKDNTDNNNNKTQQPTIITADQREQLEKYGPTPETSMEILLNQLGDFDGNCDDFLTQTGADDRARQQWQQFLTNMKEVKQNTTSSGGGTIRAGAIEGDEN